MPEFCTWWSENGPSDVHLVAVAELAWRRSPSSPGRPRPRRPRRPRGRATATGRPRASARRRRSGAARASRSRRGRRAGARDRAARSSSLLSPLVVDAQGRPRYRAQALLADRLAADGAACRSVPSSIRASAASICSSCRAAPSSRPSSSSRSNVSVATSPGWLSASDSSCVSSSSEPPCSCCRFSSACREPLALVEQALLELSRVDRAHSGVLSGAVARRGAAPSPPGRSRPRHELVPEPWPETTVDAAPRDGQRLREQPQTAAFARPSSGGAATRTFQPAPCRPTSSVRRAPGATRSAQPRRGAAIELGGRVPALGATGRRLGRGRPSRGLGTRACPRGAG